MKAAKTLYLLRHGQAFHNVEGEILLQMRRPWKTVLDGRWRRLTLNHILRAFRCLWLVLTSLVLPAPLPGPHNSASSIPSYYEHSDASLTPLGWEQAQSLHRQFTIFGLRERVDLVVVSPLTRAMQTASGVFGGGDRMPMTRGNSTDTRLLMADNVGRSLQPAIFVSNSPPFVAVELCRERVSEMPCDRRSGKSTYEHQFPGIDFSNIQREEDELWGSRESDEELYERTRAFVEWISTRSEEVIAVVSHGGFLTSLVSQFGDESVNKTMFGNCELRSVTLRRGSDESSFVLSAASTGLI